MVLNKRRDFENGIRALLREVGLKVGTPSRKDVLHHRRCRLQSLPTLRSTRQRNRRSSALISLKLACIPRARMSALSRTLRPLASRRRPTRFQMPRTREHDSKASAACWFELCSQPGRVEDVHPA
jgi:hypothetical protein